MLDTVFRALFTYRPVVFTQGEFRFDIGPATWVGAALVLVAMAAAVVTYRRLRVRDGRVRDRVVLTTLRVLTLLLLLLCLMRPTLVVRAAMDQRNVVAVLLDDSASMRIADQGGVSRGRFVQDQFDPAGGPLLRSLSERFLVRTFRFSSAAERLDSARAMTFGGTQTRVGTALAGVRDELAGLPVSGIVLVSDGADTTETALSSALLGLKADKLPVFTVGVGSEQVDRDLEVARVSTPRSVLAGASLLVDVVVTGHGYAGEMVTVDAEDDGQIVGSTQVRLPADGSPVTARLRATAREAGPRRFVFKVSPLPGELVTGNNAREALIDVRDARDKILYFEGEPRFEMKFLRRAVADDTHLQVVALQRTADTKFLRLDVDGPDELAQGFPQSRDELFAYRGLVLGSVEAGAFTGDQLQMIADFVDRRGGGLLMLGGGRAFGEGGYGGTPVADVLPLAIDPSVRASEPAPLARLKIAPTAAGQAAAITQVGETEAASVARWPQLPIVTSINAPLPAKPAATVLLTGTDERGRARPVLVSQPYGRGKALALTVQDSWHWQMDGSIPVEDQTHERFWRQVLRSLVEGVPDRVETRIAPERVEPGESATIEASVVDAGFQPVNDAHVSAQVTAPDGQTIDVPLQWTGERDGQYRGTFVSRGPGLYAAAVDAGRSGTVLGSGRSYLRAAPGTAEYFEPTLHAASLRRIAEETGGQYYTPATARRLVEDMRYAGRGVTTVEERDLWHMPIVLAALILLLCAEWGYRRAVGLA